MNIPLWLHLLVIVPKQLLLFCIWSCVIFLLCRCSSRCNINCLFKPGATNHRIFAIKVRFKQQLIVGSVICNANSQLDGLISLTVSLFFPLLYFSRITVSIGMLQCPPAWTILSSVHWSVACRLPQRCKGSSIVASPSDLGECGRETESACSEVDLAYDRWL